METDRVLGCRCDGEIRELVKQYLLCLIDTQAFSAQVFHKDELEKEKEGRCTGREGVKGGTQLYPTFSAKL